MAGRAPVFKFSQWDEGISYLDATYFTTEHKGKAAILVTCGGQLQKVAAREEIYHKELCQGGQPGGRGVYSILLCAKDLRRYTSPK